MSDPVIILCDSREPWPHPWARYLPGVRLVRATLPTGDFALAGLEEGAIIERKTTSDFVACLGQERERFDRELLRARYCQAFCVVVEGTIAQVLYAPHGLHPNSVIGSLAAWARRGVPVIFAGDQETAAQFTFRFLAQQLTEAKRTISACSATLAVEPDAVGVQGKEQQ